MPELEHHCHAIGCTQNVAPKYLMCPPHWAMVPRDLQRAVYGTYRKGQEVDKQPSIDYLIAAQRAINAVGGVVDAEDPQLARLLERKEKREAPPS